MGGWRWVTRRFQVLFNKSQVEAELDEELRFHLEKEIELNLGAGMSQEGARRRALLAFGGVERHKEEVRDVRGRRLHEIGIRMALGADAGRVVSSVVRGGGGVQVGVSEGWIMSLRT